MHDTFLKGKYETCHSQFHDWLQHIEKASTCLKEDVLEGKEQNMGRICQSTIIDINTGSFWPHKQALDVENITL